MHHVSGEEFMSDHDEILIALRRIIRAVDLRSKTLVKETGLTAPQLVVLQALARSGPIKPSTLSRNVSLSQPTITAILDRLTASGLVKRAKSDTDRRAVLAELTEEGSAAAARSPQLLQAGFIEAFHQLPSWERHMLIASLQRVAALMNAEAIDASPILAAGESLDHR
ncbi:MAG: MarR family winged helix-turn-helix transcriptional regulator [Oceanicaulis sp.]